VLYWRILKISRIVVVAPHESKPAIVFGKSTATALIDSFIVAWPFKPEATVASHDDQRIGHAILNTAFVYKRRYISMNIATHHNAFCTGKIYETILLCHNYLFIL
jgi:hypothetical protein